MTEQTPSPAGVDESASSDGDLLSPKSDSATVLVVEDDRLSQSFARGVLEDAGYRVLVASDGLEGLAMFQLSRPDCVLLDLRMPRLDGPSTCQRLRALPGGDDVAIVFMTAQRSVDAFDEAFECGADDFVTKPVAPPELLGRVQVALGLRRARSMAHEYGLMKAQRDRLMREQLQKERLSAMLVHDLKAPLNSISLLAQCLLRGRALRPTDEEAVVEMRAQIARLSDMVMNLLDISKARDGKLVAHREEIDMRAMSEEMLAAFAARAKVRDIRLEVTLFEPVVSADPLLLRRLLENLLDNALRYGPPGTGVLLLVRPRREHFELRVVDEGPGIPPNLREKVFEAFTQAEAGEREGRGLGLAFCRLAVLAHGGRIWVEDGAPGTIVCVALPRTSTSKSGSYPSYSE